jgi:hypothetical protein
MYNLLVTGNRNGWLGDPWQIEISRCVREYTDPDITTRFGNLDAHAIAELKRLPCIFAYEGFQNAPKFGVLRNITKRPREVRLEYEIQVVEPFLSVSDLSELDVALDIGKWELGRTHWAVKDVNLHRALHSKSIILPLWAREIKNTVDISTHSFDVSLSFPGEVRDFVEKVAAELESRIGPNSYFYDRNYLSQLARPNLDTLLQDIYRNRSKLIVVFIGSDYQKKDWCGLEWRVIREIIFERKHDKRIMFVKIDDGVVEGIFKTDGYIDSRSFNTATIAQFIHERLSILS